MSKINQIQSELRAIDQAKFQRLCELYLHKRGYEHINPIGLVVGADKVRKGTPDSLVVLPNGKYAFVECTTQQERVYEKFQDDLGKCFTEEKTGIPVSKIQEVVLCHNSVLTPSDENALAEKCQKHGCNLNIFGLGPIAYDLYEKYPDLARDFLGVEIDTGQIVEPAEFINTYNKSSFATPLNTNFHFREREVEEISEAIQQRDLVIISGRPGVGKSRLALECCARFKLGHPEYETYCIRNRGADLFNDLQVYFKPPGHYLILVDDANRVSGFDYFLHLLQDQTADRRIKIIVTVRDYALERVVEKTKTYGPVADIQVNILSDKEIKELAAAEFNIRHPYALDRISDIAKGNPRLAIMAARVAAAENTLHSINDVSTLYDEYFGPIWKELSEHGNTNLLKVAGIVTFFRVVDRTNEELIKAISEAFDISPELFWDAACQLHQIEVFDLYEKEVVKISDQVLSTYLFYLAFFKERALDLPTLLEHFFPAYKRRLIDALNPVLSAFNQHSVTEALKPHVDSLWAKFRKAQDKNALFELMQTFWFLKRTDVLCYIQEQIDALNVEEAEPAALNFAPDRNSVEDFQLKLIRLFRFSEQSEVKVALELLLAYVAKRPQIIPQALHLLTEDFGFRHDSYLYEFQVERSVIDCVWQQTKDGKHILFSKIFLVVAEQFLHTHFHTSEAKGDRAISMINFSLPPAPQVLELRKAVWQRVFALYQVQDFQADVLRLLQSHRSFEYHSCDKQIVEQDAAEVLPFLTSELDQNSYAHCVLAQDFFDTLSRSKVPFDISLQQNFKNELYELREVLFDDWAERSESGWEQYQEQKREQIKEFFADYTKDSYERFFRHCTEIWEAQSAEQELYQFHSRVLEVLLNLASEKPTLFVEVLETYFKLGDPLNLADDYFSANLVGKLIEICGDVQAYQILKQPECLLREKWLAFFFISLPVEKITADHVSQLYVLYQTGELTELPQGLDFLSRYQSVHKNIFVDVVKMLIEKAEKDYRYGFYLSDLFNMHAETSKRLHELFAQNLPLLKRAYFCSLRHDRYPDYKGSGFNAILDLDKNFACEYVEWMYNNNGKHEQLTLSRYDDSRNYDFLWLRDDWMEIMTLLVWKVFEVERERISWGSYIEVFFIRRSEEPAGNDIEDRQEQFITEQIKTYNENLEYLRMMFQVVANLAYQRRIAFIRLFLEHNQRFEDFTKLPLESIGCSWIGSAVPVFQNKVDYFESLLPLFNSAKLLRHKLLIEQRIQELRNRVEDEKKRDFIDT